VVITASLWSSYYDLSNMTVVASCYANVTIRDLVAGIEGGNISFITTAFNDTILLSAYNLTYDPSIPSTSDKSGMVLEWRCKRSSEAWPSTQQLATQSYVPYNGTDGAGCFGDVGPGLLGFAAGSWDLVVATSYLEPLVRNDFHHHCNRDHYHLHSTSSTVTVDATITTINTTTWNL